MKAWLSAWMLFVAVSVGAADRLSLVDAARTHDREAVLALLEQGTDVNAPAADGTTALHWAVYHDDLELVDQLIRKGANVNAMNEFGSTPMSEAAIVGNAAVIKRLLKAGADVESPNADGQTALMIVARSNHVEAAKVLLRHGAKVNAREQWRQQTALMWAAAEEQPEMVKLLIKHGADVNARSQVNKWERQVSAEPRMQWRPAGGFTPLLYAARQGCLECARHLVEGGADVNLGDAKDVTPLIMAITNFHFDLAAYLLAEGANPNKWDWWGRTPLYAAVDMNTLPHGGWPDRPSKDETTPLQLIEMLLATGANPNMQLKRMPPYRSVKDDRGADGMLHIGTTPLIRAAKAFDLDAMKLLLSHGALPDLPNLRGFTPVMAAAGLGSSDIDTRGYYTAADVPQQSIAALRLLIEAGAGVNERNWQGQTALHGAARWGWTDVVQFLVDNKADLHVKDNEGFTALDFALGKGASASARATVRVNPQTAELLEKLMSQSPTVTGGPGVRAESEG